MSDKRYTVTEDDLLRFAKSVCNWQNDWYEEDGIELGDHVATYLNALTPEPSADVVERIYQVVNTREFDEEMDSVARTEALSRLIESEVERRIKERKDEV